MKEDNVGWAFNQNFVWKMSSEPRHKHRVDLGIISFYSFVLGLVKFKHTSLLATSLIAAVICSFRLIWKVVQKSDVNCDCSFNSKTTTKQVTCFFKIHWCCKKFVFNLFYLYYYMLSQCMYRPLIWVITKQKYKSQFAIYNLTSLVAYILKYMCNYFKIMGSTQLQFGHLSPQSGHFYCYIWLEWLYAASNQKSMTTEPAGYLCCINKGFQQTPVKWNLIYKILRSYLPYFISIY